MNTSFAIIIPHGGAIELTLACLESLALSVPPTTPVVVTAYVPVEESLLKRKYPNVCLMTTTNLGFAGNCNLALRKLMEKDYHYYILLNNDTVVGQNFHLPLFTQLERFRVGMVSPKIYFYQGYEYHHDDYTETERGKVIWYAGGIIDWQNIQPYHWGVDEVDHGQFTSAERTDFCTGCCLAISREMINRIGLMREDYFLYFEDVEWSLRTKTAGYHCVYEPQSIIWHKNAGSTGGSGSKLHQYYQTRNRLVFGLTYAPLRTKLALLKASKIQYQAGNEVIRRAIRDGILHHLGKREDL